MAKIKVGIVSFAHSTHPERYLAALLQNQFVEVMGVSDPVRERAYSHAERAGVPWFASHNELMDHCEAVIICSEYNLHHRLVLEAVERGLQILCEKPLGMNRLDMEEMIAAADEGGSMLMMALPCRYLAPVVRARELVRGGAIGKIIAINATNRGACPGSWFTDPEVSGGGAIADHSAHISDLMRWLTGSEISEVYAIRGYSLLGIGVEDSAAIQVKLEDGTIGVIDASWSRTGSLPATFDVTLGIVGEHGKISVDALAQRIEIHSKETSWEVFGGSMDEGLVNDFIGAIRDGQAAPISGWDGLQASLISLAAYASISEGGPVHVDDV